MSELHIKDTTRVLGEADETFAQVLPELVNDYSEKWNSVCVEVTSLMEEYKEALDTIEKYEELLQENDIDY